MKRRALLQSGSLVLLMCAGTIARGAGIVAVRVWPAPDYSRVTIESDHALKTTHTMVNNPPRLAVDIEGLDLDPALKQLVAKVRPDDPNIAGIRVGQSAPNVVRLVIDLKLAVSPQVFNLAPVAAYQNRLVFDLYPTVVADPLETLIAERIKDKENMSASAATLPGPQVAAPANPDPLGELITQRTAPESTATANANAVAPGANAQIAAAVPPRATAQVVRALPAAPARTDRLIIVALDAG
ncbi:MAG: AMIN domain-containing protein, partial [Burkholderiaceae bacterium]